jgi:hypothetical protein
VIICAAGESCYTDLVLVEGDEMTEGVSSFCKSLDPKDPKSMVYRDNLFADVMEIFEWRCINPTSGALSPLLQPPSCLSSTETVDPNSIFCLLSLIA